MRWPLERSTEVLQWLRHRLPVYLGIAGWLLRDLVRFAPRRFALLIALSIISVFSKVATFAALFAFATARLGSGVASFRGLEITIDDGRRTTLVWGAAVVALACLMALSTFAAGRLRVRLGRQYALHAVRQVMERLMAPGERSASFHALASSPRYVRRLIGVDAMLLVRTVQPITGALLPLMQLALSAVLLLVISAPLTGVLALLGLGYALPFYRVNRRIVTASKQRETTAPAFNRLSGVVASNVTLEQYARPELVDGYLASPEVGRHLDTMETMLSNKYRVQRLNDLFLGLAAVCMVVYLASSDASSEGALGLLVFVAVARFAYGSVSQLTRSFTGFNRFLPQFQRYVQFCRTHDARTGAQAAASPDPLPMRIAVTRPSPLSDAGTTLTLRPGRVVASFQPYAVDGPRLRPWWSVVRGTRKAPGLDHVFLAADARSLPPLPLHALLEPPPGAPEGAAASVAGLLDTTGVRPEVEAQPRGAEAGARMSDLLRLVTAVAPGVALDKRIFVLARRDWDPLSGEDRERMREALSSAAVVLTTPTPGRTLPADADGVLVVGERAVLGVGDPGWWKEQQPRVTAWLAEAAAGTPAGDGGARDDEDEDMDL